VAAETFSQDEFGVWDFEICVEGCAFGVLEDVLGPEVLGAVRNFDGFVRLLVVGGGEGDVLRRVPVLGEDDVVEFFGQGVDDGYDAVAVFYGQGATGHEVVLDIYNEKGIG